MKTIYNYRQVECCGICANKDGRYWCNAVLNFVDIAYKCDKFKLQVLPGTEDWFGIDKKAEGDENEKIHINR